MTQIPSASREEVAEMLGEVDSSYVDRILDTGASLDEIGEAIDGLDEEHVEVRQMPSSTRVAEVRHILQELTSSSAAVGHVFPLQGVPFGHPV